METKDILNNDLSLDALLQNITQRFRSPELLFYSDRGTEFRAPKMRDMLTQHHVFHGVSKLDTRSVHP